MSGNGGRPVLYRQEYNKKARKLSKLGLTDAQMADFFEVSISTFLMWKGKYPVFLKALAGGKKVADEQVVRALYNRAVGYDHPETKVFNHQGEIITEDIVKHVPPDPGAAKLWLTNRRPDEWREKASIDHTIEHKTDKMTDEELEAYIVTLSEQAVED